MMSEEYKGVQSDNGLRSPPRARRRSPDITEARLPASVCREAAESNQYFLEEDGPSIQLMHVKSLVGRVDLAILKQTYYYKRRAVAASYFVDVFESNNLRTEWMVDRKIKSAARKNASPLEQTSKRANADAGAQNSRICFCGKASPSFGLAGGRRTHCKSCKTLKMVLLKTAVKCHCGLATASYGLPGGKRTHCKSCKTKRMVSLTTTTCYCGLAFPSFGLASGRRTHCKNCKTEKMVRVR